MRQLVIFPTFISFFFTFGASGQTFEPQQIAFFEKKVRPLLAAHCFECHSAKSKKLEGELRLDHREGFLKGGASGKPTVSFKETPYQSLLLKVARLKRGDNSSHPPMARPLSSIEIKFILPVGGWLFLVHGGCPGFFWKRQFHLHPAGQRLDFNARQGLCHGRVSAVVSLLQSSHLEQHGLVWTLEAHGRLARGTSLEETLSMIET